MDKMVAKPRLILLLWLACALWLGWLAQPLVRGILLLSLWPVFALSAQPPRPAPGGPVCFGAKGPELWLILWLLWIVLAIPFSSAPLKSLWLSAHYAVCAGFYFALARQDARGRELAARLIHAAGYGVALVILIVRLRGGIFEAHANWTACFAAAGFAMSLALAASADYPSRRRAAMAVFAAVCGVAVYMSQSRGALLGAVAGALFVICRISNRRALLWCAGGALAALAFIPQSVFVEFAAKPYDPFAFGRLHIWRIALDVIAHNPLAGVGARCFEHGYLLLNTPYLAGISMYGRYAQDAHSWLLNLAAENGLPAAFFFLMFALAGLLRAFSASDARPGALAAVVMAQSLFDGTMLYLPVALLFFCGLAAGAPESPAPEKRQWRVAAAGFALCLAAFAVRTGIIGGYYRGDAGACFDRAVAELSLNQPNPYIALDEINRAAGLSPHNAVYRLARGKIYEKLGFDSRAEADFKTAAALEPAYISPAASLARLYAGRGNAEPARLWRANAASRAALCAAKPRRGFDGLLCATVLP
ncbi:MAG: O-antigen ligase family protein [Elusimicrobiales bacterium]